MNIGSTTAAVAGSRSRITSHSERTPLLSVVPTRRYSRRHRSTTCTRFCYILFQVTIFYSILYLLVLIPLRILPEWSSPLKWRDIPPPHERYPLPKNKDLGLERLVKILDETPDAAKAKQWSKYYTSGAHVAGKNYSQAVWTKEKWESYGIKSEIVEYEVLLNYPVGHRLALVERAATGDAMEDDAAAESGKEKPKEDKVLFEASLEEDEVPGNEFSQSKDRLPTFHGYSANGTVTAEFVYGGYCDYDSFKQLDELKVPIQGNIVLCRYGLIFRGLKVLGAQDRGAVGVIIFTDPADDYPDGWSGGGGGNGKPYPEGSGRQPSSVQRGSVQFLSLRPGDPTTPGYASKPGVPRTDEHEAIPSIPSLPISYLDAAPILKVLNGWGYQPEGWKKGGLVDRGVDYWTGPVGFEPERVRGVEASKPTKTGSGKPTKTLLHLENIVEYTLTPIWDVIGIINGSISDEIVVIGNHRDAWNAGAGDPVSGSTAVMELSRTFGEMLKKDWKPLRTIILASWDGEEYGLVGSTEWVEEHRAFLMQNAVAYLNIDVATSGPWLDAASAPLMYKVFTDAMKAIKDPLAGSKRDLIHKGESVRPVAAAMKPVIPDSEGINVYQDRERDHNRQNYKGSIYEIWSKGGGIIQPVGSGSDFVGFQDIALIPSSDFSFRQGASGAVYHYHSNYDSFDWMEKFGDPGFKYHVAAAKLIGHMVLSLTETPVIPFSLTDYANFLEKHLNQAIDFFDKTAKATATSSLTTEVNSDINIIKGVHRSRESLTRLGEQIAKLKKIAVQFDEEAVALTQEINDLDPEVPWYRWWQSLHYWAKVKELNNKIQFFERKFVYEDGLDGREVFKHVVFAPGLWTGYSGAVFPGILESVESRNWTNVERWSEIIQKCVIDATRSIELDRLNYKP
ncbi:hypothetical protein AOL_s00080g79 [Orbilia oligospora ATCC 24927]|uniref:Uncharacterized protein n=1 Tax=Arthrobotrys oligospora (strain ATCC 24927 / CBS 115.81 / DSM 1491) TaxID=756982 RepID=G1XE44_ARTOA|nr:hypothetical protein AOL_s00080g79 [Orbilia oligospora ATCC 24927]EGX48450.1 hypothetical protein AOL_s00080g79 [Orbilia oligospora ATCC 24927]